MSALRGVDGRPQKTCPSPNPWILSSGPYLEVGSLQMSLISGSQEEMVPDFGWALNTEADGLTGGSRGDLRHGREEGGAKKQGCISLAPGMPRTASYH